MSEAYNFEQEHEQKDGCCLFEIVSNCLKTIILSEEFSVNKLKDLCHQYALKNIWVKAAVLKCARANLTSDLIEDSDIWSGYLVNIKHSADDIVRMACSTKTFDKIMYKTITKEEFRSIYMGGICGRIGIEGRILSEIFNVEIVATDKGEVVPNNSSQNTIYLLNKGGHYELVMQFSKQGVDEVNKFERTSVEIPVNNISDTPTLFKPDNIVDITNNDFPKVIKQSNVIYVDQLSTDSNSSSIKLLNAKCKSPVLDKQQFGDNSACSSKDTELILQPNDDKSSKECTTYKSNALGKSTQNKISNDLVVAPAIEGNSQAKTIKSNIDKNFVKKTRNRNKKHNKNNFVSKSSSSVQSLNEYFSDSKSNSDNGSTANLSERKFGNIETEESFYDASSNIDANEANINLQHSHQQNIPLIPVSHANYRKMHGIYQKYGDNHFDAITNPDGTVYGQFSDKNYDEYIKGLWKLGKLVQLESCKFCFYVTGRKILRIYRDDHLLVWDTKFVARINFREFGEFNFEYSFSNNRKNLLKKIEIVKVLDDPIADKRNDEFNKLLQVIKNHGLLITTDVKYANDFLMLYLLIIKYSNAKSIKIFEYIVNSQICSNELRNATKTVLTSENEIVSRNIHMPVSNKLYSLLSGGDIVIRFKELYQEGIANYKGKLINIFAPNSKLPVEEYFNILHNYQILYVHPHNIEVFVSLEAFLLQKDPMWMEVLLKIWNQFSKLVHEMPLYDSLLNLPPLTNSCYLFLLKSCHELAEQITSNSHTTIEKLFVESNNEFTAPDEINWKNNSTGNDANIIQYKFILNMMNHFRPGPKKHKFNYNLFFKRNNSFMKNIFRGNDERLNNLREPQLIWVYVLDNTIAELMRRVPKTFKRHFADMANSLIDSFIKFIHKKQDRYELLRVAAHNIIKFVVQISPYIANIELSSTIDEKILEKQLEYITVTIANESDEFMSDYFSNIIDIYETYWSQRDAIIGKLPTIYKCKTFEKDTDVIYQLLLTIMKTTVDAIIKNKIAIETLIIFMRSFNEFVEDINDIDFKWYVKFNVFYNLNFLDLVDNKFAAEEKRSYLVNDIAKFTSDLKSRNIDVPANYLNKTIMSLLITINNSLLKKTWPDSAEVDFSTCLSIASSLLSAIRSSFIYLKEQPNYRDYDLFFEESTKQFDNVLKTSKSKIDFDKRIAIIKESFWYIRKQDEIGIDEAISLFSRANTFKFYPDVLKECYMKYSSAFYDYIDSYYKDNSIENIVTKIVMQTTEIKLDIKEWSLDFKRNVIPSILGGLGAVWSIHQSVDTPNKEKSLKPHCIQIICILRLLGVDGETIGVGNHLAQVLTGQGKSVVLGLLSCLLALLGYKVQIICYSKYLSQRDQNDFKGFYRQFASLSDINYGTFDDMADMVLSINNNGVKKNIRELINDRIIQYNDGHYGNTQEKKKNLKNDTVLLIDEVDVFFNDQFYGNMYIASTNISMSALATIQELIWKLAQTKKYSKSCISKDLKGCIDNLKKSGSDYKFNNFLNKVSRYRLFTRDVTNSLLFEEELNVMIDNAINVANGEVINMNFHLNKNGRIIYRDEYGFDTNKTYMKYYNIFNYFRLKVNNFDHQNYENYGYLIISTGNISYAKLPQQFPLILGVSGTLTSLIEYEKLTIEKMYKILNFSVMPSFFGDSNLQFDYRRDFTIEYNLGQWLCRIYNKAYEKISCNRSVLIYFDTEELMDAFERRYSAEIAILHKLTLNTEFKELLINEAGVKKIVTMVTRGMGRGTDFKSSVTVEKNGGTHVIQTFFSIDQKEEVQIKGRTARKDNKGSYELVLCRQHLDELKLLGSDYLTLDNLRKQITRTNGENNAMKIEIAELEHNKSMDFLKSFC